MCVGACKQCGKYFSEPGSFEMHKCVVDARNLPMRELLKRMYASGGCDRAFFIEEMRKHYEEGDVIVLKADVAEGFVQEDATLVEINYARDYAVVHVHSVQPEDDGYREITLNQILCLKAYL